MVEIKQVDIDALSPFTEYQDGLAAGQRWIGTQNAIRALATLRETYEARIAELKRERDEGFEQLKKVAVGWQDRADSLTSANNDLLEALRPFADLADEAEVSASPLQNDRNDFFVTQVGGYSVGDLDLHDFRRAASAYKKHGGRG